MPNDREVWPDGGEVIPDDKEVIPNGGEIIPDDREVSQYHREVIPDDRKVSPDVKYREKITIPLKRRAEMSQANKRMLAILEGSKEGKRLK